MFKYIVKYTILIVLFFITSFVISFIASFIPNSISGFIASDVFADLVCSDPKTECVEDGGTRYFDGVAVTLDCWRYKTVYECREQSDNNCQQLREQGCSQVGAKCRTLVAGTCVVQDETFKCSVKRCNKVKNVICAKDIFCAGGDCSISDPTKNNNIKDNNFDKATSSLAVLAAAAEEVRLQNVRDPKIFVGKPMECSRNILPGITKDCCADNEGVFNCSEGERELFKMKSAGRAIEIGEYCYNKVIGKCTSRHRAYCVFGSKMARIVQNDGRRNQLGISFGDVGEDYAHLDCRGITKEELANMDFGKIDFSSLYGDIRKKMTEEIAEKMTKKATKKVTKKVTKKTTRKMPGNELMNKKATSTLDELKRKNMDEVSRPEFQVKKKALKRIQDFYDRTKK